MDKKIQKIAWCYIVKGSDDEADLLDQSLNSIHKNVDAIYITSTYRKGELPNKKIETITKKYGAIISNFEWVDDFSKARNFNFSQVPKEYEYLGWADCDDTFIGLEKLRDILENQSDVDGFLFDYLYAFDEHRNPIVIHKKMMVSKNDGCVTWVGRLHENLQENRQLKVKYVEDIKRIHNSTPEHSKESQIRNVLISSLEAKENPNDPRMAFNLGNSYFAIQEFKNAKEQYEKFLLTSQSDDEKYVVYQRLSACQKGLGNKEESIKNLLIAIGLMPEFPDAYNTLGYTYADYKQWDQAEKYILLGLVIKPKIHQMIVYNPREYDYIPMMALAKVYFQKNLPQNALPMLKGCLKINPNDEYVKGLVNDMEYEVERMNKVLETCQHIDSLNGDKEKILYAINKLPTDLRSHPAICRIKNEYFVKTESSGKDITYYCGQTAHVWNPEMAKTKGIGGSEEAVINLSKEWVKMGYNVTVYNSCGNESMVCDGVKYEPFWAYNAKDKTDITVLWRSPMLADYDLNTGKIFVDLHDVIPEGEFTEKRLTKIDKIFVKTKFHRSLFPSVPDNKFSIIPNGQDFELFNQKVKKDRYLLVNTSSPERSMDILPKLFKEVKKQVPQAKCKWAYGFEIFDNAHRNNKTMMDWKEKTLKEMEEAGIENCGRLSQSECAKLYLEANIFAFPSNFAEIDCISLKKAQACGAYPVTTDFGAFDENNIHGTKVHTTINKDNWSQPYQISFGIQDEHEQKVWVEQVVAELKKPMGKRIRMKEWAMRFSWDKIANLWLK